MSRTFRHTPILKCNKRDSNRDFSVESHRALRRKNKEALFHAEDEDDPQLYPRKLQDVSDRWVSKQEYKWKEFGNYWENCEKQLNLWMLMYPRMYDTQAKINKYWKQCWQGFKIMCYR